MKESLLSIHELSYKYDKRSLKGVNKLSFDILESECLCLIGPSGSGKSTALKLIAGLIEPQSGSISSTKKVELSYVPQSTELPKDKTVLEILMDEISYIDDIEKRENQARSVLSLLNITNESKSRPIEISGGQNQRVIIAKALVTNPNLILLDEPFGHLDELLRFELMQELFDLFKQNQISVLWVTHETKEALGFSDRIALLNHGSLLQIDTPQNTYEKPKSLFAANFLGKTNCFSLKAISKDGNTVQTKLFSRDISINVEPTFILNDHKDLLIIIKPEHITLVEKGQFRGKVQKQIYQGQSLLTEVVVANQFHLYLYTNIDQKFSLGQKIQFNIELSKVHCLNEI